MCDIKKKTQLKTMTVYKAVFKTKDGKYISPFAQALITIGDVPQYKEDELACGYRSKRHPMYGYVSGCLKKQHAITIATLPYIGFNMPHADPIVIKIKLGGNILKGSTAGIAKTQELTWGGITYAGNVILSIEEIKL